MYSNDKQKEYWTNSAGKLWVKDKLEKDNMLEPLGNYALSKFIVSKGSNIIDIGCGTGHTSVQLSNMVGKHGHIDGFDLSQTMIDEALKYSNSLKKKNISFTVQDIQNEILKSKNYDAAFSRFGIMFFSNPIMAFTNIFNSLKNNGLLTFICWQKQSENIWYNLGLEIVKKYVDVPVTEEKSPGPFAFADKNYLQNILLNAGYKNIEFFQYNKEIELFKGYTLESSVRDYLNSTPIFKEKVLLLNNKEKENLFIQIKDAWAPFYKDKYLLFPSKTWVVQSFKKYS